MFTRTLHYPLAGLMVGGGLPVAENRKGERVILREGQIMMAEGLKELACPKTTVVWLTKNDNGGGERDVAEAENSPDPVRPWIGTAWNSRELALYRLVEDIHDRPQGGPRTLPIC